MELQANVKKKPSEFCDYSTRRIHLGTQPSHLDINCDGQLLAVSIILNGAPQIYVYSIASFTHQVSIHELLVTYVQSKDANVWHYVNSKL